MKTSPVAKARLIKAFLAGGKRAFVSAVSQLRTARHRLGDRWRRVNPGQGERRKSLRSRLGAVPPRSVPPRWRRVLLQAGREQHPRWRDAGENEGSPRWRLGRIPGRSPIAGLPNSLLPMEPTNPKGILICLNQKSPKKMSVEFEINSRPRE